MELCTRPRLKLKYKYFSMSGLNVANWFSRKSVKLSDAFAVVINKTADQGEAYRCAGFTIPKVAEWNEEVHKFGNTSHKILIPKIDILQELTIELYEGYSSDEKLLTTQLSKLFGNNVENVKNGAGFTSFENYSTKGYDLRTAKYDDANDYKSLTIYILTNDLSKCVYKYQFENLALTKAVPYELSYSDESITKWSLSFIFESFTKEAVDVAVTEAI